MTSYAFHPVVAGWFQQRFGPPTEPQERGWPAIQSGAHTLIAAPTGSGKTLAAFYAELDLLFREGLEGNLHDATRVVYVSPLKALSNDIHKNLEEPLAGIRKALFDATGQDVDVRAAVRTGDTPATQRQALNRKPPHILVTTPESLYLLLTSVSGRHLLSTVRTLIVDEIHAVVANRRGSHLALSMERLAALVRGPLQRIGLSATQKPIEEVGRFLVGMGRTTGEFKSSVAADVSPGSSAVGRALRCAPPQPAVAEGARSLSSSDGAQRSARPTPRLPTIIDAGYRRDIDVAIEVPGSPLEAVMSNEVWAEVYTRLAQLIEAHQTTLVFVNTRRLAERVTHHLCELLGPDRVTSHHGSLSAKLRLEAESRLKRGELKALVATASLELGIDIGSVDLVCQIGPTRSIATLLQRVGRASHKLGGVPKGRLFPLSRDELVECLATVRSLRNGELDALKIPPKPLDVLAQQIVACVACEDWDEGRLFELMRSAYPYRNLSRDEFNETLRMLAEGFSTKHGRRGALVHHDPINHRVRGRRGARLVALTSGGAIPDNSDYRVVVEPSETFVGTVNEDFAVESAAGDIFQLGNTSWRILRINSGTVRVADAQGQPPNIPFWLGEAPGRTDEVSRAVSNLREELERILARATEMSASARDPVGEALASLSDLPANAASQLVEYLAASYKALGALPSQDTLIMERFFDESGGMQLVIHSPFGIRVNRAWGLALRKRFCRSFNFELQAAATDDAIVISLGTQHSFPLEEVFHYLNSKTVRELLVQALLDAPMFPVRWRWNAERALALPRQRGGHKVPAPLQRMASENLIAAVFPDQLACPENLVGDREVPDHPLVRQTIEDCLTEAMDIDGLIALLKRIETGQVRCLARDLPEPSPMAHEILNAKPYAFLDNAPLEERRTQAVLTRRAGGSSADAGMGILDAAAIERVCEEARPRATNADELHEALLLTGMLAEKEITSLGTETTVWLGTLAGERRAGRLDLPGRYWIAAERLPLIRAVYPESQLEPALAPPEPQQQWEREDALRELVRGRLEISGPITKSSLTDYFELSPSEIEAVLLALEAEGFVLRGKFHPGTSEVEWCDRRLLARIHRLTLNRLRAEIQPVTIADFQRFLLSWQRVALEDRAEGPEGVLAVLETLDGLELAAGAWEPEVLARRVKDYDPRWLDQLCFTGRIAWGRLTQPQNGHGALVGRASRLPAGSAAKTPSAAGETPAPLNRMLAPIRSSPIALFLREHTAEWLALAPPTDAPDLSPEAAQILQMLAQRGALFFGELLKTRGLLPSRVEQALAELATQGWVTADSFEGLRALLLPQEKRVPFAGSARRRRHKAVSSVEFAGRWSLLRDPNTISPVPGEAQAGHYLQSGAGVSPVSAGVSPVSAGVSPAPATGPGRDEAVETFARVLLRRYGVVFRAMLARESLKVSWYELGRVYRRLESRGEIRGGHFVSGVGGEQFALPEAIGLLRSIRKTAPDGQTVTISGADPLNLTGILGPGRRVASTASNRVLLRAGVPVAALVAGEVENLEGGTGTPGPSFERALRVGSMQAALRPYYG